MVEADAEELAEIASTLWAIVAGKAAAFEHPDKMALLGTWQDKIRRLKDDAGFDDMLALDEGSRRDIFRLIKSPYIELIFHINRTSPSANTLSLRGTGMTPQNTGSSSMRGDGPKCWNWRPLLWATGLSRSWRLGMLDLSSTGVSGGTIFCLEIG